MHSLVTKLFFALAVLFAIPAFADTSITLGWDANSEPDLAGYKVYWGTASGVYGDVSDVHKKTSDTLTNLTAGVRYYFVVTAYDNGGLESHFSDEISAVAPPPSTPTPTPTATPSATPSPTPPEYLLNISTRVRMRGTDEMIGGFIIDGSVNKDVVVRALGPSLVNQGIRNPLSDPKLEIYNSKGVLIQQNDNWTTLPPGTVPAGLEPPNPAEAAIVANLAPGAYTAILRSVDGTEGVALCELYDLVPDNSSMRNISTRGEVGIGDDVMIGGFIIGGTTPAKIMVRAIGPSLTALGVTGALPDPVLELHDTDGSLIYKNDNWRADQAQQILDTGIAPSNDRESAIVATLKPGAYTAIVRNASNVQGTALVEVYALGQ